MKYRVETEMWMRLPGGSGLVTKGDVVEMEEAQATHYLASGQLTMVRDDDAGAKAPEVAADGDQPVASEETAGETSTGPQPAENEPEQPADSGVRKPRRS